jgi:hypothetical protein
LRFASIANSRSLRNVQAFKTVRETAFRTFRVGKNLRRYRQIFGCSWFAPRPARQTSRRKAEQLELAQTDMGRHLHGVPGASANKYELLFRI